MKIVNSSAELASGCAFVPTMGALHSGHASLFEIARSKSEYVVASIFVNPLQFEDSDDLEKYPRTPDRDVEIAAAAGVTHLWLPKYEEIYPAGFSHRSAGPIGDIYEGANRVGHFDGVVTVVARLFELVRPKSAIFGEKDFQQLTLIKNLVKDLNLEIEIIAAPTVRELDGLAMSSRNIRLDSDAREKSQILYRALSAAAQESNLISARAILQKIAGSEDEFILDYAEIIDEKDFSKAVDSTQNKRAIIAGWLNRVRLIDNMEMKLGAER